MLILNILLFVVVLGVIILIHEAGHFYFAKRAGILCHEFSLGMGPALYQKRKGETVYSIRAIPIGGYVSMAGESVSDALIKEGQTIGLKMNEQKHVYRIILFDSEEADVKGVVKNYDLYGKDFDPLYIELENDEGVTKFTVLRDARYHLSPKKEMWITPAEKSFESKSLWHRFLVIFAGPLMNFILAFFLFLIVGFFVQKPNLESTEVDQLVAGFGAHVAGMKTGDVITQINGVPLLSWTDLSPRLDALGVSTIDLTYTREGTAVTVNDVPVSIGINLAGITNTYQDPDTGLLTIYTDDPIIGQVVGRASLDGGLQVGDEITEIKIANAVYPIHNWNDIAAVFKLHSRGDITVTYLREGVEKTGKYSLISREAIIKLGAEPMTFKLGATPTASFNWGYSLLYSPRKMASDMRSVSATLGILFSPSEKVGVRDLSGPVGIYTLVTGTASQGILAIIVFTGFLSINIGLLNLMPIPALDGGRLVFLGIEAVTRKPLPRKLENSINNIMFFLLMALFIFVTYNDIIRLIRG